MVTVRVLVVGACALAGFALAPSLDLAPLAGVAAGAAAAAVAIGLEAAAGRLPLARLLWTTGGAAAGLLAGLALGTALAPLAGGAGPILRSVTALVGAWVGGAVARRRSGELATLARPDGGPAPRVLDTSVIIDGRVADVAEAGFLDGTVIVPRFVLGELQRLADAGDPVRRSRSRRGFDALDRLRRSTSVHLELVDTDFPDITEVDAKLVALARALGARLLTNDAALGRVARLGGVAVGSIHDLAVALRPAARPGEGMQVQVLREGKEPGQGVAYLEDGTMVVVEGGKRFLGQALDVVVTSVLPTAAGRMIFARPRGDEAGPDA
ncbi:MAG TPA: PIN domain-containing protein [Methylomirabilota bacterium]|nr:PIN domain-containing protein [Methylomirabilota bacterium]